MKKKLLGILLGCSLYATAQNADTVKLVTPFGKPDGKETSVKIGKEGGKISSDDGKIALVIPPGALTRKTTISIQPVTNTLSASGSKTYHLQPSGIEFKQPVEIVFYYDDKQNKDNDPKWRGIAMQDEQGRWHDLSNAVVDSVNKTITGKINHFSYWVDYQRVNISPASSRVKVGKQISLQLSLYVPPQDDGSGDDVLPILSQVTVRQPPVWSVNGVTNGNANVGTVRATGNGTQAAYTAPAAVPARNPVAVTAELKNINVRIGNASFTSLKVTANVLVYDENTFEVKMHAWVDQTSLACGSRAEDEGSFIVQVLHDNAKVTDVQNLLMTIPIQSGCPCNQQWINRSTCVGPFHITGVQTIWVTPPAPPQRPHGHVRILFAPSRAEYPVFHCPKGQLPPYPAIGAIPVMLEFDTKKEEQVLYDIKESMLGLKIVVRPVREE